MYYTSSLALLYDACVDRLFAYLVFRLGRRADAEEVVQRLSISLNTAASRVRYGLGKLRQQLRERLD